MKTFIIEVSPVIIPDEIPIVREIQRPLELREYDYESRFDYKTLYYDVFIYGNKIIFSGPPLFNLRHFMQTATIKMDDAPTHHPLVLKDKRQTQYSYLEFHGQAKKMDIDTESFKTTLAVQPNHNELFDNKKVLLSIQKDNKLEWIKDWVDFYVKVHGVNAILLYDNASSLYTPSDIIQTLKAVKNLDIVVVVSWPFKYGQRTGSSGLWDTLFCQYSMFEHARRRFLASCYGVINADIDELIISDDDKTVFDHLALSDKGAVTYDGIWIDSATNSSSDVLRHRDFKYTTIPPSLCPKKWTARPSAISDDIQFQIHDFGSGFVPTFVDSLKHRHFRAISTSWKYNRNNIILPQDNTHTIDHRLVAVMDSLYVVYISLGENALADDILKRHGLKSFSTPYSGGRSNIDYAIFLESINYKGLLDKENLKYDYIWNTKVVRSTIVNKSDSIYEQSCMNGFEFAKFAKNDDVLGSDNDRDDFNTKIQKLLELRGKKRVVFFYHHRVNKNSNLESIFEKAGKFLEFYSKEEQAFMVIFTQKIIKDKTERKLSYRKISNTIHFFEFCTEHVWGGNNPDVLWARVDEDLVKDMIQSSIGIVNGKNGHITPSPLPKKVVKNINTDYVISLGNACLYACRTAYHLGKNNLRVASNPLDWVSRYSLDTVIHLFETGFSDFFYNIQEDVSKAKYHRCVKDISNNIIDMHLFPKNGTLEEAAQLHHSIMKKRYERMHNNILQSDHILFVSNRNEPLDNFKKFLFSMYDIYHKKFTYLNIRDNEKESEVSIDFTEELKFIEYSFVDVHKESGDNLSWTGNVQKWTEVMQTITLSGKIPAAKDLKDFH